VAWLSAADCSGSVASYFQSSIDWQRTRASSALFRPAHEALHCSQFQLHTSGRFPEHGLLSPSIASMKMIQGGGSTAIHWNMR
jgi:hypothetical protein